MAQSFNLTAQLQLQSPNNINQVIGDIRKKLKDINVGVKVVTNASSVATLNKELSKTKKNVDASKQSMDSLNRAIQESARRFSVITIATGTFLGFASSVKNAVKESIAFEKELIRIKQVTGDTNKGLKGLSDEVTRLATSIGASSSELLKAATTLAQAGFTAEQTRKSLDILAKTTLGATFGDIQETTEGVIAILNQFGKEAVASGKESQFLEKSLDALNSISKAFAVESSDLISAIRRTGGVFAATGGKVEELAAIFTSVRATTRESAETIATGLRTIFTRIQRTDTINQLKALGVELRDSQGRFVGAFEAVKRLSEGLSSLDPRDYRYSDIVEELGGFRQVGKVIPLIQQFATAQKALAVAQRSGGSIAEDAQIAQEGLGVQIDKVREKFDALIRKVSASDTFQNIAKSAISLAEAFIKVADSLTPLLPLITSLIGLKLGKSVAPAIAGLFGVGQRPTGFGPVSRFARGGVVPGTGNSDTVPAMLTPGEFVIKKSSVKKLGVDTLRRMNENRYAKAGKAKDNSTDLSDSGVYSKLVGKRAGYTVVGAKKAAKNKTELMPPNKKDGKEIDLTKTNFAHLDDFDLKNRGVKLKISGKRVNKLYSKVGLDLPAVWNNDWRKKNNYGVTANTLGKYVDRRNVFATTLNMTKKDKISTGESKPTPEAKINAPIDKPKRNDYSLLGNIDDPKIEKEAVEAFKKNRKKIRTDLAQKIKSKGDLFFDTDDDIIKAGIAEDLFSSIKENLNIKDEKKQNLNYGDQVVFGLKRFAKFGYTDSKGKSQRQEIPRTTETKEGIYRDIESKLNSGGSPKGSGGIDTIPALLTPGEFVFNKQAAQRIGYGNLNRMNKQGVAKFAKGGPVGFARLAGGGDPEDEIRKIRKRNAEIYAEQFEQIKKTIDPDAIIDPEKNVPLLNPDVPGIKKLENQNLSAPKKRKKRSEPYSEEEYRALKPRQKLNAVAKGLAPTLGQTADSPKPSQSAPPLFPDPPKAPQAPAKAVSAPKPTTKPKGTIGSGLSSVVSRAAAKKEPAQPAAKQVQAVTRQVQPVEVPASYGERQQRDSENARRSAQVKAASKPSRRKNPLERSKRAKKATPAIAIQQAQIESQAVEESSQISEGPIQIAPTARRSRRAKRKEERAARGESTRPQRAARVAKEAQAATSAPINAPEPQIDIPRQVTTPLAKSSSKPSSLQEQQARTASLKARQADISASMQAAEQKKQDIYDNTRISSSKGPSTSENAAARAEADKAYAKEMEKLESQQSILSKEIEKSISKEKKLTEQKESQAKNLADQQKAQKAATAATKRLQINSNIASKPDPRRGAADRLGIIEAKQSSTIPITSREFKRQVNTGGKSDITRQIAELSTQTIPQTQADVKALKKQEGAQRSSIEQKTAEVELLEAESRGLPASNEGRKRIDELVTKKNEEIAKSTADLEKTQQQLNQKQKDLAQATEQRTKLIQQAKDITSKSAQALQTGKPSTFQRESGRADFINNSIPSGPTNTIAPGNIDTKYFSDFGVSNSAATKAMKLYTKLIDRGYTQQQALNVSVNRLASDQGRYSKAISNSVPPFYQAIKLEQENNKKRTMLSVAMDKARSALSNITVSNIKGTGSKAAQIIGQAGTGASGAASSLQGLVLLGATVSSLTAQMSGLDDVTKSAINQTAAFAGTFVALSQGLFSAFSQASQAASGFQQSLSSEQLVAAKQKEALASNQAAVADQKEAIASNAAASKPNVSAPGQPPSAGGKLGKFGGAAQSFGGGALMGITVALSGLQYFSAKAAALADQAETSVKQGFEDAKNGISVNVEAIKQSANEEIALRNESANFFSKGTIGIASSAAVTGAALGAFAGPVGAAVGGLLGATAGIAASYGLVKSEFLDSVTGIKEEREAREAATATINSSIDSIIALNQAQNELSENLARTEGFSPEETISRRMSATAGVGRLASSESSEARGELSDYATRFTSTVSELAGATDEQIRKIVESSSGVDNVEAEIAKIKYAAQQFNSSTELANRAVKETENTFNLAQDNFNINKPESVELFYSALDDSLKAIKSKSEADVEAAKITLDQARLAISNKTGEERELALKKLTQAQKNLSRVQESAALDYQAQQDRARAFIQQQEAQQAAMERATAAQIAQYQALQRANAFMDQLSARSADLDKQSDAIDNFTSALNNQVSSFAVSSVRGLEDPTNVRDTQRFAQEIAFTTQNAGPEAQRQGRELARLSQISQEAQKLIRVDVSRAPEGATPESILQGVGISKDSVGEDIFKQMAKELAKVSGKVTPEILSGILSPLAEQTGAYAKNIQGIIDNQNKELQNYAKYLDAFDSIRDKELESREKLSEVQVRGFELRNEARGQKVTIDQKQANRIFQSQSQLNAGAGFRGGVQLRAGDVANLKSQKNLAQVQLQRIQIEKNSGRLTVQRLKELQRAERQFINTINDANTELEKLADQGDRASDILGEIGKEQAKRETLTKIIEEFVVGGTEERRAQVEAFAGIQNVLMTGTLQGRTSEQRAATVGLLDRLEDITIPFTGGLTGKEVKQEVVFRDAIRMGLDPNIARQLATATSKEEKLIQALDRLTQQMEAATRARAGGPVIPSITPITPAKGGFITPTYKKDGGTIFKPKGTDTVPAMLTPGEFVVRKSAVDKVGVSALEAINNGSVAYRQNGSKKPEDKNGGGVLDWIGAAPMRKNREDRKVNYTRLNIEEGKRKRGINDKKPRGFENGLLGLENDALDTIRWFDELINPTVDPKIIKFFDSAQKTSTEDFKRAVVELESLKKRQSDLRNYGYPYIQATHDHVNNRINDLYNIWGYKELEKSLIDRKNKERIWKEKKYSDKELAELKRAGEEIGKNLPALVNSKYDEESYRNELELKRFKDTIQAIQKLDSSKNDKIKIANRIFDGERNEQKALWAEYKESGAIDLTDRAPVPSTQADQPQQLIKEEEQKRKITEDSKLRNIRAWSDLAKIPATDGTDYQKFYFDLEEKYQKSRQVTNSAIGRRKNTNIRYSGGTMSFVPSEFPLSKEEYANLLRQEGVRGYESLQKLDIDTFKGSTEIGAKTLGYYANLDRQVQAVQAQRSALEAYAEFVPGANIPRNFDEIPYKLKRRYYKNYGENLTDQSKSQAYQYYLENYLTRRIPEDVYKSPSLTLNDYPNNTDNYLIKSLVDKLEPSNQDIISELVTNPGLPKNFDEIPQKLKEAFYKEKDKGSKFTEEDAYKYYVDKIFIPNELKRSKEEVDKRKIVKIEHELLKKEADPKSKTSKLSNKFYQIIQEVLPSDKYILRRSSTAYQFLASSLEDGKSGLAFDFDSLPEDFKERYRRNKSLSFNDDFMSEEQAYDFYLDKYFAPYARKNVKSLEQDMLDQNLIERIDMEPENKSTGGPVYRANGGTIFKPKGTDTVPAMLTPGEFVIRKSAVDKVGVGTLQAINNGQGFSSGGVVYRAAGGPVPGGINAINNNAATNIKLVKGAQLEQLIVEGIAKMGSARFFNILRATDKDLIEKLGAQNASQDKLAGGEKIFGDKKLSTRRAIAEVINSGQITNLKPVFSRRIVSLLNQIENSLSQFGVLNSSGVSFRLPDLTGLTDKQKEETSQKYDKWLTGLSTYVNSLDFETNANDKLTKNIINSAYGIDISAQVQALKDGISKEMENLSKATISAPNVVPRVFNIPQLIEAQAQSAKDLVIQAAGQKPAAGGQGAIDLVRASGLFLNNGGRVPYFSSGGGVDSIPAMLTPGEFVMNADTVRKYGVEKMKQLNKGNIPGFNRGGSVGGVQYRQEGGSINPSAGGTLSLDTSRIQGVFDNFIGNFSPILDNITKVFSGVSNSLNKLAESFGGFTMQHTVTVEGLISLGGLNIDSIKNELSTSIGQMVADEVTKRMDDQSNKFSAG